MRKMIAVAIAGMGLFVAAAPIWAHHAFAQEFDEKRPLKLKGTVTKWELINPHSWIHIDVKNADGSVTNWMVEGGSPNNLFRLGFTRDSLPPGTVIMIDGFQAKDGSNRAVGQNLTFTDGRRLFLSNSAAESGPNGEQK
jgi:Family of unknown function (DUF6152)